MINDTVRTDIPFLRPSDDLDTAEQIIEDARLGGLPVVDEGKLTGAILERDLDAYREMLESKANHQLSSLVLPAPVTLPVGLHPYEAMKLFSKIPQRFIPIADKDATYAGLVLFEDVMTKVSNMLSADAEGVVIEMEVPAHQFRMSDVIRLIEQNDARVLNVASRLTESGEGQQITMKLQTLEPFRLQRTLERYSYVITYISHSDEAALLDDTQHKAQEFIRYLEV